MILLSGCVGSSTPNPDNDGSGPASNAQRRNPLSSYQSGTIRVKDQTIRVWIASTPDQQSEGLMFVPPEELADDQGMLFVFPTEDHLAFWMLNTITPLDIAYARLNGTVVSTWQMPPQTFQTFPSLEPAMFALEMKQGAFARLDLRAGDKLEIPVEILGGP